MESISITKLTDHQWNQYFNMTQEICKRYYPEFYDTERTIKSFKDELLNYHNLQEKFNHQQYLILEKDIPTGYYTKTKYPQLIAWDFDMCTDEIPDGIFREIMSKVYLECNESDINLGAYNWIYDKRKIAAVNKTGAKISEKLLITRVYRKDMDKEVYRRISEEMKPGKEFKIIYLNKYPDDIIQKLPAFFNECNKVIDRLRPDPIDFKEQTLEDIQRYININTDINSVNHILIILDNFNEIAAICCLYQDKNKVPRLRHHGGFTGVTAKYRGKGFGKFMKAYLYNKLLNENVPFEYATTDTMPWNTYMFRINEELGFKPHKEGFEFKLTREILKKYLSDN